MTSPKLSVVMSIFNGERFLREAMDSVLAQSFQEFEFIVINDGSTDGSGSLLESYQHRDSRVRVYHQENKGLITSLNRGCELAQAKYIARMDADDVAMNDRFARQYDFMEEHPEIAAVGGAVDCIDAAGKLLCRIRFPLKDREIREAFRDDCAFCHPTVLMRKEVFIAVGGYRKVVVDAEDYDLWLRISDSHQLANLKAVVLGYRLHPQQVSVRKCTQQGLSALAARAAAVTRRSGKPDPLESIREITPGALADLGVGEAALANVLARQYLTCIRNMYQAGEYSLALSIVENRSSDFENAERWVIADFHLWAAKLHYCRGKLTKAIFGIGHAIFSRPIILVRPLKPLWRLLTAMF